MACDHSSIIIIIIIIIITTTTTTTRTTRTTGLYFSQKWNYNEIRKRIIMNRQNRHSCITLEPRGWRNCFWAIPLWIIIIVYMIICCLWIIGWKSIGHCAVLSSYISSHMPSQTAYHSFICGRTWVGSTTISGLLTFLPKKERFDSLHSILIIFYPFFVSTKIVMNPQVVLLLLLVAVPCTSAGMLLLPFCNV